MTYKTIHIACAGFICVGLLLSAMLTGCTPWNMVKTNETPEIIATKEPTLTIPALLHTVLPTPTAKTGVWQPPEPSKRVVVPTPTEFADSPNVMLVYVAAGLGLSDKLKITTDGQAVLGGHLGAYITYTLTSDEFESIKQQIKQTDFPHLADKYWVENPPNMIIELPVITIIYKDGKLIKEVAIRGGADTPQALQALQTTLNNLTDQMQKQFVPTKEPDTLVSYYIEGYGEPWWLDINVEGGLYYGLGPGLYYANGPAKMHLTSKDFMALHEVLEQGLIRMGSEEWYTAPGGRKNISDHWAIVRYYKNGEVSSVINAFTGATVPDGLQAVLEKLAELYDKYAPTGN